MKRIGLAALVMFLASVASNTRAQDSGATPDPAPEAKQLIDLKTTLVNGLKVTRKSERAFVNKVVGQVAKGNLSDSLVTAMFRYAQRKNRRYPFPYFERAMKIIAATRKVAL